MSVHRKFKPTNVELVKRPPSDVSPLSCLDLDLNLNLDPRCISAQLQGRGRERAAYCELQTSIVCCRLQDKRQGGRRVYCHCYVLSVLSMLLHAPSL
jgi:hypothetical protein